ncbi:probable rhodanese domain-containing dual specificity protein phosphatase [Ptychodera flava]|uniref:probable rhodanese domain-containing dual specificity protein phosphatase n=1 Tax=Ptychodera flava TaxID=63121 RepID=UPI003969D7B3
MATKVTNQLSSPTLHAKQFHKPEQDRDGFLIPVSPPKVFRPEGFVTAVEFYNQFSGELGYPFIHDEHFLLLLDTRTNAEYEESHITTARMYSDIYIDYNCLLEMGKLDAYTYVTLYDADGKGLQEENSQLMKTYSEIRERGHDVAIILGGFQEFAAKFPFLCNDKVIVSEPDRRRLVKNYPSMVFEDILFQGSGEHAIDEDVFKNLKITHVVNISTEVPNAFPNKAAYLNIQVSDEVRSNIMSKLSLAADFIASAIANGGRVLVHCVLGASRSSTIVIAYLIKYHGWTLKDAYDYLKECRPCVSPNRGFLAQLSKFEEELFGKKLSNVDSMWF